MNSKFCILCALSMSMLWGASSVFAADEAVDAKLNQIFADYHEQYLILFPVEATNFGDARYNDQLPLDISEDFIAKEKQFYQQTLSQLSSVDATSASETPQLMAKVLEYELKSRLKGLEFGFERIPFNQFDGLPLTFAQMGSGSGSQPFKTLVDYENWLKRITAFEAWTLAAIDRFREGMRDGYVLPKVLVRKMVGQLLDETIVNDDPTRSLFYAPIEKIPASFSEAERQDMAAKYRKAVQDQVMPAYRRLGEFLRDEYLPVARDSSGISALPAGREQYEYWVRYWTTTAMSPDEIFDIGQSEVKRITAEMEQVRQQMQFDGSLDEFFEYLRSDPQFKPFRNAEEVLDFFRQLRAKLEPALAASFLNAPKTPFEIRRTESFREKTASAEYMPGSADGSRPGVFYCPIPDAEQFNITGGMESLFLHEALPGHHYQISLQQENQQLPDFARFLWYGAYGEGWALYCESIGAELGLYTDPRQRVGALGDEMHRAIRLVVDVGMHWKGWSREQAIEYMLEHEPIAEDGAVAEIERYMAFTAQALSYKIGQLKILQLRRDCEQRLGNRFSLPAFHDQVLRNGCLPLSILEQRLNAWQGVEPTASRMRSSAHAASPSKLVQEKTEVQVLTPSHADIVFAEIDGFPLKLDLYLPATESSVVDHRPPLVVWIHGGGWRGGSKAKPPLRRLVDEGYALASINYRFTDRAIYPAQLHDCKAAIRWLRAHAEEYGYASESIAVAGSSAGGTLALLLGTTGGVPELEGDVGGNLEQSSRVECVVDYFGPSDFVLRGRTQPEVAYSSKAGSFALLGGQESNGNTVRSVDKQLERLASASEFVSAGDPPLLVFHGTDDALVLPDQSERIVSLYAEHGLSAQLVMVPGAAHGGSQFFWGRYYDQLLEFLERVHLPTATR